MANEVLSRDQNRITVGAGVTDDVAQEIRMFRVDDSGRLLISAILGNAVTSISKLGSPQLTGNVTLSEGSGITLTQVGQNIQISSAGGGTVTSVSVVTANGVSGSVANATTTPAITLTLGAITPTTVNGLTISTTTGTLTLANGSTLVTSGANSITLTSTGATNVTLPTTGTLVNTAVTTLSSLVSVGTITTGVWNGTAVDVAHGGTGNTSLTAYAVLCGGTTGTGAIQPVASVGTAGQVLTSNGAGALPTFQNAAGGGLALAGSDLTERTTTNTTITNLSSVTGLNISTATPIMIVVDFRKSAGAAEFAFFDIVINATQVYAADSWTTNSNQAESGICRFIIAGRTANYLRGLEGTATNGVSTGVKPLYADMADIPNAAITSITIRGRNQSTTANTVGTNNMRVYTMPTT